MKQRQAVTAVTVQRYRNGSKKVKQQILDEFCETTGYSRGYARFVLRNHGRQVWLREKKVVVGDARQRQQRLKPPYYDEQVVQALIKLWQLLNYLCGKRLVAIMPELIVKLEQFGELRLTPLTKQKLLRISAASVDRLLQPERRKQQLRRRSHTKPGTLLKHQIPIRTFAEWDEAQPGFAEMDLVAHDGGLALGDYCQTLDLTDICTGWTETEAVPNKAQVWVFEAIQTIRARLPFPLRGLDSDNGSEFVNQELLRYCQKERLTFTRARPYRKNDNCYVEQKNYSVVRQTVGYQRFDTAAELMVPKQLYATLRLYTNFFQPTMKLKSKERFGSRVKKSYHRPQTPYQRVLACAEVAGADKKKLQRQYQSLNPAALKRSWINIAGTISAGSQEAAAQTKAPPGSERPTNQTPSGIMNRSVSSRFLYEATNQVSRRFLFEAIGSCREWKQLFAASPHENRAISDFDLRHSILFGSFHCRKSKLEAKPRRSFRTHRCFNVLPAQLRGNLRPIDTAQQYSIR